MSWFFYVLLLIGSLSVSGEIDSRDRYDSTNAEGHYPVLKMQPIAEGHYPVLKIKLYEHRGFNGSPIMMDDSRQPFQHVNNFSEMYYFDIFHLSQNGLTNRSSSNK